MEEETLQSAEAGAVHAVAGRGIYGSLLDLPSEQVLHAGRSTALLRLIGLAERRVGGRRISTGSLEVEQLTQPLRVWTLRAGAVGFNLGYFIRFGHGGTLLLNSEFSPDRARRREQ